MYCLQDGAASPPTPRSALVNRGHIAHSRENRLTEGERHDGCQQLQGGEGEILPGTLWRIIRRNCADNGSTTRRSPLYAGTMLNLAEHVVLWIPPVSSAPVCLTHVPESQTVHRPLSPREIIKWIVGVHPFRDLHHPPDLCLVCFLFIGALHPRLPARRLRRLHHRKGCKAISRSTPGACPFGTRSREPV